MMSHMKSYSFFNKVSDINFLQSISPLSKTPIFQVKPRKHVIFQLECDTYLHMLCPVVEESDTNTDLFTSSQVMLRDLHANIERTGGLMLENQRYIFIYIYTHSTLFLIGHTLLVDLYTNAQSQQFLLELT